MMIKFSWKKINDKFDWNAYSVLEYFYLKQNITPPLFLIRKIPEKVKKEAMLPYPPGNCFLVNINRVLSLAREPNDLYLYLELASKRNVFDYNIRRMTYLPTILAEEYQLQWVEINPLLHIEDNNIYFKYEQE